MAFRMLTHNELVKLIAKTPREESLWGDFVQRFHAYICCTITRELKRLHLYKRLDAVEDLAQEVYARLLTNDCQALKNFKGQYENSIFSYLEIIAIRIVLLDYAKTRSKKRTAAGGEISLDDLKWNVHEGRVVDLKEILHLEDWEEGVRLTELKEEIRYHLDNILGQRRNKERDELIFRYYLYAGLEAEEIALCRDINLSEKRVLNIIGEIKQELSRCLRESLVVN
jgi:RNA polymerase sigma factor (sigma-70 family)